MWRTIIQMVTAVTYNWHCDRKPPTHRHIQLQAHTAICALRNLYSHISNFTPHHKCTHSFARLPAAPLVMHTFSCIHQLATFAFQRYFSLTPIYTVYVHLFYHSSLSHSLARALTHSLIHQHARAPVLSARCAAAHRCALAQQFDSFCGRHCMQSAIKPSQLPAPAASVTFAVCRWAAFCCACVVFDWASLLVTHSYFVAVKVQL